MTAATSPSRASLILTAAAMMICCGEFTPAVFTSASAQAAPDTDNGRYTLSPTSDGVVRLDTRTGAVSNCTDKGNGWACYTLPDERAALDTEIGRLQTENEKLKTQLAERAPSVTGKTEEALPKSDSLRPSEPKISEPKSADANRNRIEIPLPSDRDMDRVMSFVERAWRRLIEMAGRVQRDVTGKI
ncbi:MAG: hypothetical protein JSS22_22840 [Proteobacteria bacterium]|nr:hypothetical protein [Pseudomonadota bacterium]